jgi:hypothetical protein
MITRRQGLIAVVAAIATLGAAGAASAAAVSPAQVCEAAKVTAAGKMEQCLAAELAKEVKGKVPNYAKCSAAFAKAFTKAETKAGPGVCPSEADTAAVEALIDGCFADLGAALAGTPNPQLAFPATGQTTCWNSAGTVIACPGTGQDGEFQAGGALSYTDNGDGTITDTNTGLTWEKKTLAGSASTEIHHVDRTYTWDNAFAVHIAGLNSAAFGGHTDWRLPNVRELQSIVNYARATPSVSPAFNTGCSAICSVVDCSCTAPVAHWSSSTLADNPMGAWLVTFGNGTVFAFGKTNVFGVRAVRGGL